MAYGKRYFFEFYDLQENLFTAEIHKLDYVGDADEVQAAQNPVVIDFTNTSDNKLEPLRGSKCTLKLIADEVFEFADLYTENEREWLVIIKQNGDIKWRGFILPDGCQENFSYKPYIVTINAVDGLGLLKNLKFVGESGSLWIGKMSFKDIIWNCLNRLQIPDMPLNTSVNIYPSTLTPSDTLDPLAEVFCDTERYYTGDTATTPMNCEEVLKSVMQSWTASIVQMNGEWFVYRPNEIADSGTIAFRKYLAADGDYDTTVTLELDNVLGGESEGATLFHRDRNQLKRIGKPYKTTNLTYKYGEKTNIIRNGSFYVSAPETIDDWIWYGVNPNATLTAGVDGGATITYTLLPNPDRTIFQNVLVSAGELYTLSLTYSSIAAKGAKLMIELVGLSSYYYSLDADELTGSGTVQNPVWRTDGGGFLYYNVYSKNTVPNITPPPAEMPNNGEVTININLPVIPAGSGIILGIFLYAPYRFSPGEYTNADYQSITYKSLKLKRVGNAGAPIGETHTVTQDGLYTFIPDTQTVLNGDGDDKFVGSLFIGDTSTRTALWNRRGIAENDSIVIAGDPAVPESKSFLRIATEEIARLYGKPYIQFEGSVFGYFDYLSRFSINDVPGVFLPTSLTYELQNSLVSANFAAISDEDVDGLYSLTPVYDNVTKVSVV